MVGQIVATKIASASVPDLPVPWSQIQLGAGVLVAVSLVLKFFVETSSLGIGSYLGVGLGVVVAVGAVLARQEESSLA